MITGKIRYWPKGDEYINQCVQIWIKVGTELVIFNKYMDDSEMEMFRNYLVDIGSWDLVETEVMNKKDPRKMAQTQLNNWAKLKGHTVFTHTIMFITQIKMEMLNLPKTKNNKSCSLSEDEGNTEI